MNSIQTFKGDIIFEDIVEDNTSDKVYVKNSVTGKTGWVFKSTLGAAAVKTPFTTFKFIQKGFGNNDITTNEIGDIFCGWSNDGTIRISEAIWLGGSLTDSNNFTPLVQTEI